MANATRVISQVQLLANGTTPPIVNVAQSCARALTDGTSIRAYGATMGASGGTFVVSGDNTNFLAAFIDPADVSGGTVSFSYTLTYGAFQTTTLSGSFSAKCPYVSTLTGPVGSFQLDGSNITFTNANAFTVKIRVFTWDN